VRSPQDCVDAGAGWVLLAGFAQHHQGVADADITVVDAAVRSQAAPLLHSAEHLRQEADEAFSVVDHDVGLTLW